MIFQFHFEQHLSLGQPTAINYRPLVAHICESMGQDVKPDTNINENLWKVFWSDDKNNLNFYSLTLSPCST